MPGDTEDRIALIDLDGTLADYDTSMAEQMERLRSPGEPDPLYRPALDDDVLAPYITARRKLIQRQAGFWRDLPTLSKGFAVVAELRRLNFSLHVLTKGPKTTPNAWSEKLEWCNKHLSDAVVTITGDKSLVYGRVLFDDFPPYFEKWLLVRPRGRVVCLAHPWNETYAKGGSNEHPRVFRYTGANHEELIPYLARAYERKGREEL